MSTISNAEKQARFRKKEELKRYADKLYREHAWRISTKTTPEEMRAFLDKTVDLPSGWTNGDYESAVKALNQFALEFYDNPHQLANDVQEGKNSWNEFMTTPDPAKFVHDGKAAIEKTRLLSAHLTSSLELSGCSDSDQAAALMEVVRFVGRSLLRHRDVPKSQATTMCLASLGPQYARPDWFVESLTKILGWNLNKDLAHNLGDHLKKFNYEM